MTQPHLIVGIGELLWDILPEGMRLGGAPANFAVMAGRLGDRSTILSRVGRDDLARQAIEHLDPMPVDTSFLQVDAAHETGQVTVDLSSEEPHFTIHQPAAWDFLQFSDDWVQLAERADAICFGSLAQRSQESRQTIQSLAAQTSSACIRVFDVNLRAPWYSAEIIQESMELATVVKMNEDEAPQVLKLLGLTAGGQFPDDRAWPTVGQLFPTSESLRFVAERLLAEFPALRLVAITRGMRGSLVVTRDQWNEHPGFPIMLADGIGAGDAFTAAMTHYLLHGADLTTLNEAGNRWGGWMASQSGAMPALPDTVRDAIAATIAYVS